MGKKENDFYEYFAKYHIESLYKTQNLSFKKSERPDFLSERNSIGLEVTRAYIEEWKQRDAVVEKYLGKGLSFLEVKRRVEADCKHGFEGRLFDINGTAAYSPTKGMYNTKIHELKITESIEEKTELLENYKKCYEFGYICRRRSILASKRQAARDQQNGSNNI